MQAKDTRAEFISQRHRKDCGWRLENYDAGSGVPTATYVAKGISRWSQLLINCMQRNASHHPISDTGRRPRFAREAHVLRSWLVAAMRGLPRRSVGCCKRLVWHAPHTGLILGQLLMV